jgi:hypothetical protein
MIGRIVLISLKSEVIAILPTEEVGRRSAGHHDPGGGRVALSATIFKNERTRTEHDDLQQAAGHHHTFQEVDQHRKLNALKTRSCRADLKRFMILFRRRTG